MAPVKKKKLNSNKFNEDDLQYEYAQFSMSLFDPRSTKMAKAAAVNYFRRLFTENIEPPDYFDENMIDLFIDWINDPAMSLDIKIDAAWTLTNLLCSTQRPMTHTILEKDALQTFVFCISHSDDRLRDQCIWAVGNIAADCVDCKGCVRATDVIDIIADQLLHYQFKSAESEKNVIWTCLNILKGGRCNLQRGAHPRLILLSALTMLSHRQRKRESATRATARSLVTGATRTMISNSENEPLVRDCLSVLSMLADDRNFDQTPELWSEQIDALIEEPRLIEFTLKVLAMNDFDLSSPALRLLGNIITGSNQQTEAVIMKEGFIQLILLNLGSSNPQVQREAAWILSNVATGPASHIDLVLGNDDLFDKVFDLMYEGDLKLRKECTWFCCNLLASLMGKEEREEQLDEVLGMGILGMAQYLNAKAIDIRLVDKMREVITALMITHPEFGPFVIKVSGGKAAELMTIPIRHSCPGGDYIIDGSLEDTMETDQ